MVKERYNKGNEIQIVTKIFYNSTFLITIDAWETSLKQRIRLSGIPFLKE